MIDVDQLGGGLGIIAVQTRHPLDTQTIDAYHLGLGTETEPEEWARFCRGAVVENGWRFFPGLIDVIEALREFRRRDIEARALPPHVLTPEEEAAAREIASKGPLVVIVERAVALGVAPHPLTPVEGFTAAGAAAESKESAGAEANAERRSDAE